MVSILHIIWYIRDNVKGKIEKNKIYFTEHPFAKNTLFIPAAKKT
mgnify:FL=1|jgi:hypothetical protein